jgi:hypothetical protein
MLAAVMRGISVADFAVDARLVDASKAHPGPPEGREHGGRDQRAARVRSVGGSPHGIAIGGLRQEVPPPQDQQPLRARSGEWGSIRACVGSDTAAEAEDEVLK